MKVGVRIEPTDRKQIRNQGDRRPPKRMAKRYHQAVAKTVATTDLDGMIWSSRAKQDLLVLLLHITQCYSVLKPIWDYESAALTVELQGHKNLWTVGWGL
jgi:hypothetical protein